MRQTFPAAVGAAWLAISACGGDGTTAPPPGTDGQSLAQQFEHLADSVDGAGYSPTAEALRHAAEIVRLTGHATPVTLTIDGAAHSFLAVAEQLDFPNLQCTWPGDTGVVTPGDTIVTPPADTTGPDSAVGLGAAGDTLEAPPPGPDGSGGPGECTVADTISMRTFIAWEPARMAEVVRIVADAGSSGVDAGVPDVMSELPAPTEPSDTGGGVGVGPGGLPGFFGEYLVSDTGSWYTVDGRQSNSLEASGGACTAPSATFDWAEFECVAARFRFEFDMRVEPLRYVPLAPWAPDGEPPPSLAEGSRTLALAPGAIDGVRLTVVAWTPPPLPPPGPGPDPIPVDSAVAER